MIALRKRGNAKPSGQRGLSSEWNCRKIFAQIFPSRAQRTDRAEGVERWGWRGSRGPRAKAFVSEMKAFGCHQSTIGDKEVL